MHREERIIISVSMVGVSYHTRVTLNPLYSEKKPVVFTVYTRPLIIPVYGGLGPPTVTAFCSCSWVLIYSIGHTLMHSMPPARERDRGWWSLHAVVVV